MSILNKFWYLRTTLVLVLTALFIASKTHAQTKVEMGNPNLVEMPKLVGKLLIDARIELHALNIELLEVDHKNKCSKPQYEIVTQQYPNAGVRYDKTIIKALIYVNSLGPITVPNVRPMGADENTYNILIGLGFKVNFQRYPKPIARGCAKYIFSGQMLAAATTPNQGQQLCFGDAITLYLEHEIEQISHDFCPSNPPCRPITLCT